MIGIIGAMSIEIDGIVENSILSHDVVVKKGAVVKNAIIYSGTVVEEGAEVNYSIIDENVKIGKNAKIGEDLNGKLKICVLGRDITVADGKTVSAGEIVDENV